MKKFFVFAAVAATTLLAASCNKNDSNASETPAMKEIAVNTVATRGYITDATFYNTVVAQLHEDTPATTPRVMWLSSYLTPQSGENANYFVNEPFSINANGEDDDKWHHNPKLYWPIGGTLDFLAYSAENQLTGTKCVWDETNAASKLILNFSEDQSQDDVVYASAAAVTNSGASAADVAMEFKHTQAWIEFQLDAETADVITIESINLSNIYMKGEATIAGAPAALSWNFASFRAADYEVDDVVYSAAADKVYGNALGTDVKYLDMLIPAQAQTQIVIKYTLAGQETELEYVYDLTTASWEAGKKYIYKITFKPREIIVVPSVTVFGIADVSGDDFPSEIA